MSPRIEGRWKRVGATRTPGGWRKFYGLPGLPGYTVSVRYVMEDGKPRFAGLRVEPENPDATPGLAAATVRALPVADMVSTSALMALEHVPADADGNKRQALSVQYVSSMFDTEAPERPKGGSPEFSAAVTLVWNRAREMGYEGGGTKAIRDLWNVSAVTAERWVREARAYEVMEPSQRVLDAKAQNPKRKRKGKQ